jgi:hypothetical protein
LHSDWSKCDADRMAEESEGITGKGSNKTKGQSQINEDQMEFWVWLFSFISELFMYHSFT